MNPALVAVIVVLTGTYIFLLMLWSGRDRSAASVARGDLEEAERALRAERSLTARIERDAFDTLELDPHDALARMVLHHVRTHRGTPAPGAQ